jgi:hypothetical protein
MTRIRLIYTDQVTRYPSRRILVVRERRPYYTSLAADHDYCWVYCWPLALSVLTEALLMKADTSL